jgi:hypothetical protein
MALVATAGDPTANAYIDVAGADAYFANRLQASAWTGATAGDKASDLIWATRILDTRIEWNGIRTTQTQALDWPRSYVRDPNSLRATAEIFPDSIMYVPSTVIPQDLQDACCEMAMSLIVSDRSLDATSRGIKSRKIGSIQTDYDGSMAPPVLPRPVRDLLRPYGRFAGSGGSVELVRA